MSKWAFSLMARRWDGPNTLRTNHVPGVLEAATRDEATGKAMRIARKVYPASEGWHDYDVVVQSAEVIIEPEGAYRIEPD